jgi:hypothetical protein
MSSGLVLHNPLFWHGFAANDSHGPVRMVMITVTMMVMVMVIMMIVIMTMMIMMIIMTVM